MNSVENIFSFQFTSSVCSCQTVRIRTKPIYRTLTKLFQRGSVNNVICSRSIVLHRKEREINIARI